MLLLTLLLKSVFGVWSEIWHWICFAVGMTTTHWIHGRLIENEKTRERQLKMAEEMAIRRSSSL